MALKKDHQRETARVIEQALEMFCRLTDADR
jgi:hypothetical protein